MRQRGSHVTLVKRTERENIVATVPIHTELKKGTLLSVIRQSRLNKEDFVK